MKLINKFFIAMLAMVVMVSSCTEEEVLSNEAEIISFSLSSPAATGTITGTDISVDVPFGTDLTSLAPSIEVSEGATVTPASGLTRDFTSAQTYVVTAEDETTTQTYTVTVNELDPETIVISEFSVPEATEVTIDQTNLTITVKVLEGTDVTALVPTITTIPAGVSVSPESGVAQDFTNSVNYTATSGETSTTYAVSVEFLAIGADFANITIMLNNNVASSTIAEPLSSSGDNERGFAMNDTYVFAADKGTGEVYYWNKDGTSVAASTLSKVNGEGSAVVTGGVFTVSDVLTTDDGSILVSNMNWSGGDFKVYKYADVSSNPEVLLTYTATYDASTVRFGDAISFKGDPNGTGTLYVMAFPGFNSVANNNFILAWDVVGGAIANPTTPTEITLSDQTAVGNYAAAWPVSDGGTDYLLVNGANIPPTLYATTGGTALTSIESAAIGTRTLGGEIFTFNEARYLALALPGSEGANVKDAGIEIFNITGGTLIEGLNSVTAETRADKLVHTKSIGQELNGNIACDVDIYIDGTNNELWWMAGAANNGLIVEKAPLDQ